MAYQFIHAETYSSVNPLARARNGRVLKYNSNRRWSVTDALGEADRLAGHIPHIVKPQTPTWHIGSRQHVLEAGKVWLAGIDQRTGKRVAANAPWLMALVTSLPEEMREDRWPCFRDEAIKLLRETYGARLIAVVEHLDEAKPHFHAYIVPAPGATLGTVHPGKQASDYARRNKLPDDVHGPRMGVSVAYKRAMSRWQDDWHSRLCAGHGLDRFGPRRERYTRARWKQQKALEEIQAEIVAAEERKRIASNEARKCELEAERAHAELRDIQMRVDVARAQAAGFRKEIEEMVSHARSVKNLVQLDRVRAAGTLRRVRSRCLSRRDESRHELARVSNELQKIKMQHEVYLQQMMAAFTAARGPEIEELRSTLDRLSQAVERQDPAEARLILMQAQRIEHEIPRIDAPPMGKRPEPPC